VPSTVVPNAGEQGEEERVPGDAAAHAAGQARQAPDPLVAEPLGDGGEREAAGLVDERAGERHRDRQGDEEQQQRRAEHDGAGDEGVAAELAGRGEAAAEQHQEREQRHRAADAEARLARGERAERRVHPGERPAGGTDREAAAEQSGEADERARADESAARPARGERTRGGEPEACERDPQPRAVQRRRGAQAARRIGGAEDRAQRLDEGLVGGEMPGQERERDESYAGPREQRRPHPVAAGDAGHSRSM
jgi:hypothetical protein